jgi:hypothetical protein
MCESTSVPVTCDRRLCDSQSHVYQFHARVGRPIHSGKLQVSLPLVTSCLAPRVQAPPSLTHAPTLTVSCDTGLPSNEASTESYPQKHPDATADDITCPGVSSKPFEPQTETRAWDYAVPQP